ncbi:putative hemolysin [Motilimonas pumila]|uniref:DUF333 domain-containing protein n=1 Tax=Motilimonas pumila TaxID=2303987 RepID=A0A418YGG4_9GAMM|nr:DUF333 domain-containing protein [Motilimonas pumila]RJG48700.1 DUF333 domain-containing protein [Motilimonas pumila]
MANKLLKSVAFCALSTLSFGALAGMGDPASKFCEAQGGKIEHKQSETGDMGICHTSDGQQIEAWTYYRHNHVDSAKADKKDAKKAKTGMSNPAASFCEEKGGKVEHKQSQSGDMGICHTSTGEQVEVWTYYRHHH